MSAAVAATLDRETLRAALARAVADADLDADQAADILAAYDAGALGPDALPAAVARKLDRALTTPESDEDHAARWALALLALVPIARAAFPGAGVKWLYNSATARYVSAGGVGLQPAILRRLVDRTIASSAGTLTEAPAAPAVPETGIAATADASADLAAARLEYARALTRWQAAVEEDLLARHVAMAAAGRGGLARLTDDDRAIVRERVLREYEYLDGFRTEIEAGTLSEAQIRARLAMYAEAPRGTFAAMDRRAHEDAGFIEERNLLDAGSESCDGCERESARGWVPIGTLVPICERDCLANDRCGVEFRRAPAEESAT